MNEFWHTLTATWWGILVICVVCLAVWILLSVLLYRPVFKRFYDILLSGIALILLSPIYLILAICVRVKLGKPVIFKQRRPGKNGKIFYLHKFRTMTDARNENGDPLPDEDRMTRFGNFLRSASLDELPEIWDIFRGKMSIIGPRPLREEYLPLYNEQQKHRHDVRPGLTGLAQVSGRNAISWERKFELDVQYVRHYGFFGDAKIFFKTIGKVFKRDGIAQGGNATMPFFTGTKEYNILVTSCGRRVELVNAFKAARDRLGVLGKVVCADCSRTAPALSFGDASVIVPRIDSGEYIDAIEMAVKEYNISLIVPTIDTELALLAKNKACLEAAGACVLIASEAAIEICGDKVKSAAFFKKHGFDAPHTLTDEEMANYTGDEPLFIKPRDGSSSINAFKIVGREELEFFVKYVKNPIVQTCARGQEYTVDAMTDFNGNPVLIVPRKRLAVRSGEILKGQIDKNQYIIDVVKRLLKELNFVGHLTVQGFLTDDGRFLLIEMNARFGGGAPMSIKAGADFCEKLYRMLRGEKLDFDDTYKDGTLIVRFDNSVVIDND